MYLLLAGIPCACRKAFCARAHRSILSARNHGLWLAMADGTTLAQCHSPMGAEFAYPPSEASEIELAYLLAMFAWGSGSVSHMGCIFTFQAFGLTLAWLQSSPLPHIRTLWACVVMSTLPFGAWTPLLLRARRARILVPFC